MPTPYMQMELSSSSGYVRDPKSQMQPAGFTLLIDVPNAPQKKILDQVITCSVKSSLQIDAHRAHSSHSAAPAIKKQSCAHAGIVALFYRCLFPDDAAEQPPSVSTTGLSLID